VAIDSGDNDGHVAVWRQNDLTLRGVGGRPHLRAGGRTAIGFAGEVADRSSTGHALRVEGNGFVGEGGAAHLRAQSQQRAGGAEGEPAL
jgi:hypothetical protein